jgi:hypothetical protein
MDRNNVSYAAAPMVEPAVEDALDAVQQLIILVEAHVARGSPPYLGRQDG